MSSSLPSALLPGARPIVDWPLSLGRTVLSVMTPGSAIRFACQPCGVAAGCGRHMDHERCAHFECGAGQIINAQHVANRKLTGIASHQLVVRAADKTPDARGR